MGVLMIGVDMPKNCEECNFKGECRDYWAKIREAYTRPSWCPLVEVFDKDINVRSKTEPQTGQLCDGCEYSEPYIEYKCTHPSCKYEDEPQTERSE